MRKLSTRFSNLFFIVALAYMPFYAISQMIASYTAIRKNESTSEIILIMIDTKNTCFKEEDV